MCSLSDLEASRLVDQLRRESRPTLKPDYLAHRRATEDWLFEAVAKALGRSFNQRPSYFFLGDFSHLPDRSRPSSLIVALRNMPANAMTFTLGDSMTVAAQSSRKLYRLDEVVALFVAGTAVAEFGLSDESGFQARFIEVQLWDNSSVLSHTASRSGAVNRVLALR